MARKPKTSAQSAVAQARKSAKLATQDAKFQKKLAEKIYKEKLKEMRPYLKKLKQVDLRKSLSPSQKSFISRAWSDYEILTLRPIKIYRTKSKKKLRIAQRASQHTGHTKFDVAFVPTADPKGKIEIKGDSLIVSSQFVDEKKIPFNMLALAADPMREIQRVIDANPEYASFVMMAGEFIYNGPVSRDLMSSKAYEMAMRYAPGGASYEHGKNAGPNHHYLNWFFGMKAFKAKNQKSIEEYTGAFNNAVKRTKMERKKKRRARGIKYGTKF